ncbi:probable chitinase 10 [Venturia canescens]|uniref:probable chitinase 10 n=1 Tax=Venturia canescens TaxID=32260 RepID=UPI001C9C5054|nr:probable chitinase 10 [Venturia canescens]
MARPALTTTIPPSTLVFGVFLLAVSQASVSECPSKALWNETVQIPHEYDCEKFYTCVGRRNKVERQCPPMDGEGHRLHFNKKLQVCDWPSEAGCKSSLLLKIVRKPVLAEKPIPTKCPRVDSMNETVHLAHEWDCTKFYKCHQGRKILMSCPTDKDGNSLYFNPREQVCDWPFNVDCQMQRLTLKKEPVAKPVPTSCPKHDSPNETVHLAHERDCTKFYTCSNGKKILQQCPLLDDKGHRLYFDPEEQVCDWPSNVDCKLPEPLLRIPPVRKILPVPTECPEHDPPNYEVNLVHENDCTKFYKCFRGVRYLLQCPVIDGTQNRYFFNKETQRCDFPWNAGCDLNNPDSNDHSPTSRTDESDMAMKKRFESKDFNLIQTSIRCCTTCKTDPEDIIEGLNMLLFTALIAGFVLLVTADSDDDIHLSDCSRSWIENKTRYLSHENDCRKYYVCLGSRKVPRQCAAVDDVRYFFSDKLHHCVPPKEADCHLPLPPRATQLTVKKELSGCNPPTSCPRVDPKNTTIHLSYKGDCTKFYKCLQGYMIEMQCPKDQQGNRLYFNPCEQVCDWSFNVDCPYYM